MNFADSEAIGQAQGDAHAVDSDTAPCLTESDAAAAADRIVEQWINAPKSVILACSDLVGCLNTFAKTSEKLEAFLARLVAKRVLSENDKLARLKGNGKLAMLGKIGRNAEILSHPSILCHLPAHYSVIYQICLLIEEVGRERAVAELAGYHDTTREDVIKIRAALKAPEVERKLVAPPTLSHNEVQLFAVRLTALDARIFANNYARFDTLDECLRRPQPADNAGLVAIVPIRMLGTLERALMPLLGFSAPNGIFLEAALNQPEITDRDVIVVAHRGSYRPRSLTAFPSDAGSVLALAEYFYPDCDVKCQPFAKAPADGWLTLIGDENWIEKPSVR